MNRAYVTLGLVCAATAGGIGFVHWRQQDERARMHKGVLRDIAKEQMEASARAAAAAAAGVPSSAVVAAASLAAPLPSDPKARACEGDICDLAQTRFRDPVTGQVYVPGAAGSPAPAAA